jgi:hypothetical protein
MHGEEKKEKERSRQVQHKKGREEQRKQGELAVNPITRVRNKKPPMRCLIKRQLQKKRKLEKITRVYPKYTTPTTFTRLP